MNVETAAVLIVAIVATAALAYRIHNDNVERQRLEKRARALKEGLAFGAAVALAL